MENTKTFLKWCYNLLFFLFLRLPVIFGIPLRELSQAVAEGGGGFEAEVGFEGGCVGVGYGHVAGLHGHEFLVGFEVVVGGEHFGADEFFLQYCHEVEEVLGVVVADVIDFVGREW